MTKIQRIAVITLSAIVLCFGLVSSVLDNTPKKALSDSIYESNNSTTTRSTSASATYSYAACVGGCQLSSIVVTQPATAGYVRIWNATSTATSTYQAEVASSTAQITWGTPIAKITGAGDAFGTLEPVIAMQNGIVIETSTGFDGEYIISWKR